MYTVVYEEDPDSEGGVHSYSLPGLQPGNSDYTGSHRAPVHVSRQMGTLLPSRYPGCTTHAMVSRSRLRTSAGFPPASPFGQLLRRHGGGSHRNTGPPKGAPIWTPRTQEQTPPTREDRDVKIVSLLPSATEIVFALGLGDQLKGVSFECDYPAAARQVPIVSGTVLSTEETRDAAQVDAEVSALIAAGESIYTLDDARIRSISPDVILAQDLCRVCAVPSGAVEEALGVIGCQAQVVSLDPEGLDEVIACVGQVGRATGAEAQAETLMGELRTRIEAVRARVRGTARPRVFVLEWPDPPFNAGHWVPEMVEAAGGEPVLAEARARSVRLRWDEIAAQKIDVTVFSPCGFDLAGAVEQAHAFLQRPETSRLGRIVAVDANAFFSRPGPRVVDGVELLADLLHPERPGIPRGAQELQPRTQGPH
jgi:iron complex transport system substrate-binding protein